jgi:ribosomal protein L22
MADETPELEADGQTPVPDKKAPRRRAGSAEPVAAAPAAKPARARRAPAPPTANETTAEETAAEEKEKPRRPRIRAKAAKEETVADEAPKPRRIRARQGKAEEGAAEALAELPAPKPSTRAAKKPATRPARRLVPGRRAAKDAPALGPQLVHAHARYVRSSARKARIVCDHIRGKSVPEARAILAFAPRGVAKDWAKLLDSAVANAEHNHELIAEDLHVKAVVADVGPTLKRFRPRAMGRATPINKRTAHLSITLAPKE